MDSLGGSEYLEPVGRTYCKRPTFFVVVLVSSNPSLLCNQSGSILVILLCFVAVKARLAYALQAIGTGVFRNYSDEKGYMVSGFFYCIVYIYLNAKIRRFRIKALLRLSCAECCLN